MDYLDGPTQSDEVDSWAGNDRSLDRITVLAAFRMLASGQMSDKLGLDEVSRFPVEPPEGSVLKFTKTWGNSRSYNYVALRVGSRWFLTGKEQGGISWEALKELIHDNPCAIATTWANCPVPEPSPFEEMTPAEWHAAMWPQNTTVESATEQS